MLSTGGCGRSTCDASAAMAFLSKVLLRIGRGDAAQVSHRLLVPMRLDGYCGAPTTAYRHQLLIMCRGDPPGDPGQPFLSSPIPFSAMFSARVCGNVRRVWATGMLPPQAAARRARAANQVASPKPTNTPLVTTVAMGAAKRCFAFGYSCSLLDAQGASVDSVSVPIQE